MPSEEFPYEDYIERNPKLKGLTDRERREYFLRRILKYYKQDVDDDTLDDMLDAVHKFHPEAIYRARPILIRNEDFFSIRKLVEVIDDFNLQPEQEKELDTYDNPERAGFGWTEWENMREDAEEDEDGHRGSDLLERMREDPESLRQFEGVNPYDKWLGRDTDEGKSW